VRSVVDGRSRVAEDRRRSVASRFMMARDRRRGMQVDGERGHEGRVQGNLMISTLLRDILWANVIRNGDGGIGRRLHGHRHGHLGCRKRREGKLADWHRRRQRRLLDRRGRSRGFKACRHDWQVLGGRSRLASGLLLEELRLGARLNAPVVALAWIILGSLNLDKVLVEAQVVTNAVLPAGIVGVVEGIVVADPPVNLGEGEALVGRSKDGHSNQLGVAVRWLGAVIDNGRV
jgi:hypothetical protein